MQDLNWRISSFSTKGLDQTCVAMVPTPDGNIAVRNSNDTDGPVVHFTPAEIRAFLKGVKAGEFDDMGQA